MLTLLTVLALVLTMVIFFWRQIIRLTEKSTKVIGHVLRVDSAGRNLSLALINCAGDPFSPLSRVERIYFPKSEAPVQGEHVEVHVVRRRRSFWSRTYRDYAIHWFHPLVPQR